MNIILKEPEKNLQRLQSNQQNKLNFLYKKSKSKIPNKCISRRADLCNLLIN